MSYLIDTNVLSELVRPTPNKNVLRWFENVPDESLYISVLTLGEIRKGIEKISDKSKREKLRIWLEHEIPNWFGTHILSIDIKIADRWGKMLSQLNQPAAAIDSLIAATALQHDLSLVTRNVTDFNFPTLDVINPWDN
jgi:predicted nucleic acid-binding protein